MPNKIIEVQNIKVNITNIDDNDYICISDFGKYKEGKSKVDDIIRNWLRNRITLEFLGTWESIYNPNFNSVEFDGFRKSAGLHTFTLSVTEWCEKTNAIGIYSKRGKYGGTYAHKDIAFEFASAISPVFKLYLIKEFERLKEIENQNREWDVKRILTKNNYLIHTDAIKNYILPDNDFYKNKEWLKYAEEADILNVIIFNTTAKKWRELNPNLAKNSNVRDYASINQLNINENTIIIAHSIAPIFVCKYLITNKIKVKKLVFVCGFNNYLGIDPDFDAVNEPMFIDDLEEIKDYCNDIVCYYSDNDPYVKFDVEKAFADEISNEQYIIKNGGHINAESGYTKFEEILKSL